MRKGVADPWQTSIAKTLVAKALRSGILKRHRCQVCYDLKSQAHHEDYTKSLDVIWLCSRHHAWRQKQLRDAAKKDSKPPYFIYAAAA